MNVKNTLKLTNNIKNKSKPTKILTTYHEYNKTIKLNEKYYKIIPDNFFFILVFFPALHP